MAAGGSSGRHACSDRVMEGLRNRKVAQGASEGRRLYSKMGRVDCIQISLPLSHEKEQTRGVTAFQRTGKPGRTGGGGGAGTWRKATIRSLLAAWLNTAVCEGASGALSCIAICCACCLPSCRP